MRSSTVSATKARLAPDRPSGPTPERPAGLALEKPQHSGRPALRWVALTLILAPLFLFGCAAVTETAPPATPDTRAQAMEAALRLASLGQDVSTMAVRGAIDYSSGTTKHYFRFELISQRPASFHFTIIDPLGRPAVRIVSDGQRALALEYGPATATVG